MTDLILFCVLIVVAIGLGTIALVYIKKRKPSDEFNLFEFLYEYIDDIIDISKKVENILKEDKDKYLNEEMYEDALLTMVSADLIEYLSEVVDEQYMQYITQDLIQEPLNKIYHIYCKLALKAQTEAIEVVKDEPVVQQEPTEINSAIDEFYKEEK